jgi:hypothetical protein
VTYQRRPRSTHPLIAVLLFDRSLPSIASEKHLRVLSSIDLLSLHFHTPSLSSLSLPCREMMSTFDLLGLQMKLARFSVAHMSSGLLMLLLLP